MPTRRKTQALARGAVLWCLTLAMLPTLWSCSRQRLEADHEYPVGLDGNRLTVMIRVLPDLPGAVELSPMVVMRVRNLESRALALDVRAGETVEVSQSGSITRKLNVVFRDRAVTPTSPAPRASVPSGVLVQKYAEGPVDIAGKDVRDLPLGRIGIRPPFEDTEIHLVWEK